MRHIRFMLIVSAIALLSTTAAQATVIYNWYSTSPGPYVTATGGELVITDAAYRSGSIDFYANYFNEGNSPGLVYDENGQITNSPVVSVDLSFSFTNNDGFIPDLSVNPGSYAFTGDQIPISVMLTFDGVTLSGSMSLVSDSGSDDAEVDGSDFGWDVSNYISDYFRGPCGDTMCYAGSGYWLLSSGPVGVPEPPVWPLFGLGVLGLLSLLRLRRRV